MLLAEVGKRMRWSRFLALALVLQIVGAQLGIQGASATPAPPPANATTGVPNSSSQLVNPSTLHEAWFFYLSSLALTITASSTLLVALAVIKIQSLGNSLTAIERSVAEAFHKINKPDDYVAQASVHLLDDQWPEYLDAVEGLANKFQHSFLPAGRD